jgi:hypothetical protein
MYLFYFTLRHHSLGLTLIFFLDFIYIYIYLHVPSAGILLCNTNFLLSVNILQVLTLIVSSPVATLCATCSKSKELCRFAYRLLTCYFDYDSKGRIFPKQLMDMVYVL